MREQICMYVCAHVCMCVHMYVCVCTCMYVCAHVCMCAYKVVCLFYTYVYKYLATYDFQKTTVLVNGTAVTLKSEFVEHSRAVGVVYAVVPMDGGHIVLILLELVIITILVWNYITFFKNKVYNFYSKITEDINPQRLNLKYGI